MFQENVHPSDQDLLLWADGELSSRRAAKVRRHLSSCWKCRARMSDLEQSIAAFVHQYQREVDVKAPPIEGPRSLLIARMEERAAPSGTGRHIWRVSAAAALAAVCLSTGIVFLVSQHGHTRNDASAIPNASLTPGATTPIRVQDVCTANAAANDPAVPDPLKREVLKEYGLNGASENAYQIDYLVTPQLGGAASIRNLWPQPSLNTVWNARVKDALENRLHDLVCSGQVDLGTAQHEISQNWVAAYKKYFRTNEPLHSM